MLYSNNVEIKKSACYIFPDLKNEAQMAARHTVQRLILSVLIITFGILPLRAQTIKARVSVQFQHLQATEQDFLEDLGSQLEDYINDYTWSDLDQDIVIQTTLQIIIETVTNRGSDRIYRAQFLIFR